MEQIDETATLKDLDLNFIFRLQTSLHQEVTKQIDRECEFLEDEGIMGYGLLVGLHFRNDSTGEQIATKQLVRGCRFLESELQSMELILADGKPFGIGFLKSMKQSSTLGLGSLTFYKTMIDISKRLEHAYKSLQVFRTGP